MPTSLASLQQGNVRKSKKIRKSSYSSNDYRNFDEIFRKDAAYDNFRSHKKTELHPLTFGQPEE